MAEERVELTQFLNQQYLCESLTINEVQTLIDYTETVTFNKGDVVAEIGEVGEALFFVISGEIGLYRDDEGKENEVARVKEGELLGEMSFFDRRPRTVRLRAAKNDTRMLRLSRAMYKRLRVEHPYIAVNLAEHAIVSLDHLFRRVSKDITTFANYFYSPGRK
ncbi:MAG: cyclic nucleotide-binding domain-containing protein [Gammaproteobacteria bacterium]|nr:cyclic nucleotide-binding domain-containing protein [Gammaproteobacteria bacterium]MDH5801558.1 cyclic nucleotide-binding domain-containing protein [Gammaproteobacteria bacterium]